MQECAAGLIPVRPSTAGLEFAAPPLIHQGELAAFDTVPGLLAHTKAASLEQAFFRLTGSAELFERLDHREPGHLDGLDHQGPTQ